MGPPLTLELLATPAAVPRLRGALRAYGIDVRLCVSELVTNVVRHVGEGVPVTVRVWRDGGRVRVGVTDPEPGALPVLCGAPGAEAESGRGLVLLDALAVRWGVDREPGCKTVWCELFASDAEDGEDGEDGQDGKDGENSEDGVDGQDGATAERSGRRGPSAGALGHPSARS
ncbi:ATP-binding protein [Streptomyces sp. NPDC029526]|uniref:ATP-binding protein n=1 Tax=Streptomyces sp. NPDC029526 TaxID=3155728 RepID=UPI003407B5A3